MEVFWKCVFLVLCQIAWTFSQLNLPQYQSGSYSNNYNAPSSNSQYGGYNNNNQNNNNGGYSSSSNSGSGGYQSSYSPPSSSYGKPANTYSFDNYKAPPRSTLNSNTNTGHEAQGSNLKVNVGFSGGNQGWGRPAAAPKPREAWKAKAKGDDFKLFTTIGSGIDHVKGGVKKVIKGVKSTKAKIVAKGIKGVGTAVSAVTKGVAGAIEKLASW